MNQTLFWISLSSLESISKRKIYDLWRKRKELTRENYKELCEKVGIQKEKIKAIEKQEYQDQIKRKLEWMQRNNIFAVFLDDKKYPKMLKEIYDPPIVLYGKGRKEILNQFSLSMIGCRQYSLYGRKVAYTLASQLSKKGITIVSGLAKGIDTFSHEGALTGKGKTIAIIGSGLDCIYPKENNSLANRIIQKDGLLLSEYLVGTPPLKFHFPARNRLISGMSQGVIVVEAKEKSGTMITVDYAIEQGKNIFSIPGNVGQENSMGTNQLIKEGAKMVTKVEDVLEEY